MRFPFLLIKKHSFSLRNKVKENKYILELLFYGYFGLFGTKINFVTIVKSDFKCKKSSFLPDVTLHLREGAGGEGGLMTTKFIETFFIYQKKEKEIVPGVIGECHLARGPSMQTARHSGRQHLIQVLLGRRESRLTG